MSEQHTGKATNRGPVILAISLIGFVLLLLALVVFMMWQVNITAQRVLSPIADANNAIQTQVSNILHPTPTIIPDPITIIHEVRSLARLETIQYTLEKVITAEVGQGELGFLFGDRLLFVAHGTVIAGVDLAKLTPEDMTLDRGVLYVRLPAAEVFVATLDNEKSYVYDRETGLLTKGYSGLESRARVEAEQEILKAAIEDGILVAAQQNAESYLGRLFGNLGYEDTVFLDPATPIP